MLENVNDDWIYLSVLGSVRVWIGLSSQHSKAPALLVYKFASHYDTSVLTMDHTCLGVYRCSLQVLSNTCTCSIIVQLCTFETDEL